MFPRTLLTTMLVVVVGIAGWAIPSTTTAQYFGGPYFYDDTPPRMGYVYPGVPYTNRYGPPYYQGYGAPYANIYVPPFPPVPARSYNYGGYYYGPTTGYYNNYCGY